MGCQNSKLNGDILAIPPKLRPLLWRRVEELRQKRSGGRGDNSGTISKKELLTEGGGEDQSDGFSRDHESLHESEGLINDKTSSQDHDTVCSSVTKPKTTIIVEDKKITYKKENIIMEPEKKIEINMEIEYQERSVIRHDKEEKEKEEERDGEVKEEDRKDDEEDEREYIGPSSPSFRVYFVESLKDQDQDQDQDEEAEEEKLDEGKDDSKEDKNDMQKECSGEINSENVVLIASNEDPETKIIKKRSGKSRMRFRRALRRGGPVAVKHLLNVGSCYHPNSDVRATLLARKSTS